MNKVQQSQNTQVKLNRLQAQKAGLEKKLASSGIAARKARTRNLIQLGGLLNMVALTGLCGIEEGNDLQLEAPDKAAVLLGLLQHLEDSLPHTLSENQIEQFRQKGIRVMKNHTAEKTRF